jgi:hypothetical protein
MFPVVSRARRERGGPKRQILSARTAADSSERAVTSNYIFVLVLGSLGRRQECAGMIKTPLSRDSG